MRPSETTLGGPYVWSEAGQRASLLVPLDGTEQAKAAIPVARALAEVGGGTVHLVHVARRRVPVARLLAALHVQPDDLHDAVVDVLSGDPVDRILALGSRLERPVVVLCASAPEGPGPVVGPMLERASFPVVVVKPERLAAPWSLQRVLLAHQGPATAGAGLAVAVDLAERAGASLVVVHVPLAGDDTLPAFVDQPQHEWPFWSRRLLERLGIVTTEVPQVYLATGDPGDAVVRLAARQEADLVAIAGPAGRDEVVRRCSCPVLALAGV